MSVEKKINFSSDGKVMNKGAKNEKKLDESSLLYQSFSAYQNELDTRNDKYERLVKMSRDITIQSKRVIFGLLRKEEDIETSLTEAKEKIILIQENIFKIGMELEHEDSYKFTRSFSPGFQEFIEAVTLLHYIKTKKLISYADVNKLYFQYDGNNVLLTPFDYMLGVADLTGELMRMAINSIGEGALDQVDEICLMLRTIYSEFSKFNGTHREMNKKINVMKSSLGKVENACYTLKVRGREVPTHMVKDIIKDVSADINL